jgi:hypothetical protein
MYTLSTEEKLAVLSALVKGNSICSISRITNVDRNTIASLLLRTGDYCADLLRFQPLPDCKAIRCLNA